MSASDNSISLAVELAIHLLPAFTGSHDFDDIFKVAGEVDTYETFGALLEEHRTDKHWKAEPKRLLGVLIGIAAFGANMDLDDFKRLVLRRMGRDAENRR